MDETLKQRSEDLLQKLDLDDKRKQIRALEAESMHTDFWQDSQGAAKKMKALAELQKELEDGEMFEMLLSDRNETELIRELDRLEYRTYLSGPYDRCDALMSLHAGQGGTEAMDWTSMLYRMYTRFIDRKGWSYDEIDSTAGDEAGLKSVTIEVNGRYAYGFLKSEIGVHRLVRQSPFNADNLRQTSFAMVEVLPVVDDIHTTQIKEEEIEWEFYRSGGKGGQNVNKVSTAVRLKHLPSGIVVTSQSERYQGQNRESALKLLRAKLWEKEEQVRLEKEKAMKGAYKTPGWGNQIRSYVLHPYRMVKDLRTQHETSQSDKVLDGEIEDFMIAYLKNAA